MISMWDFVGGMLLGAVLMFVILVVFADRFRDYDEYEEFIEYRKEDEI